MTGNNLPSTTPTQGSFDFTIALETERDGVGMGVLSNGTPYLTLRGLALMCGVDHSMIVRITAQWMDEPLKRREKRIREIIRENGGDDTLAFQAVEKEGTVHHIVPDVVCMAILEYYAFEANTASQSQTLKSYRVLARKGFQHFIYSQVGYNPTGSIDIAWRQFHDRVSLSYHTVPDGYFSVFKEIAEVLVTLIREGSDLGSSFIPDISVGQAWARYWKENSLEVVYGERRQYDHNYPNYFPQSLSNPQPAYCYPDDALGEFRKWLRKTYLVSGLPKYLNSKVSQGQIPAKKAAAAIEAFKPKSIPSKKH
ncbi:MAG: hypothetical protein RLN85_06000 [Pseudomonadales bacterium]